LPGDDRPVQGQGAAAGGGRGGGKCRPRRQHQPRHDQEVQREVRAQVHHARPRQRSGRLKYEVLGDGNHVPISRYWTATVRRGQGQRNHQDQSRVYQVMLRLDGEECKAHQEKKSPPARRRRPSRPKLAECTVSGSLCEEVKKGQRDHQEPSSVYRVRRRLYGEV
jgi:hypothetical protein